MYLVLGVTYFPRWQRYQRLMDADQDAWWEIMGKLQKMFRKGAQVLFMTRKLDRDQMHNYFMSGESVARVMRIMP